MISAIIDSNSAHKGFSIFHVYTSCVTFDKQFKTWANLKERVHYLPEDYDPTDLKKAMNVILEDNYAMGVIYRRV